MSRTFFHVTRNRYLCLLKTRKIMFKEIVLKITQIITNPEAAWRKLKGHENHESFINRYLHPVFGVISLTTFVGGLWLVADGGLEIALKNTIISLVTVYGGYFIALIYIK